MNVIKPSIPMRSNPNETSALETECLFGESLTVLDTHLDWYYCRLSTDNYYGWVQKKNLNNMKKATHRVVVNRTFFYKKNNIKKGYINYLPLGAQICVVDIDKKWAKVNLFESHKDSFAYIPSKHLIEKNSKIKNWVGTAEKLIGTPYVWGGRNSIGLDCSALLQLSYQTYGENIARNSSDQVLIEKKIVNKNNALKRGFTVFWKGHVGIMTDDINCVHANAFHMEVTKEPLNDIIARTNKNNPIIKIMNFN